MQKEDILAEIRRTAQENGGRPLGVGRFESETGIRPYDWSKYWIRFSEAQREAGFEPNTLKGAYSNEYMYEELAKLTQKLNHYPVKNELRMHKRMNPDFPSSDSFYRIYSKDHVIAKLLAYCSSRDEYNDVVSILKSMPKSSETPAIQSANEQLGEVYLFKSGRHYKIGMTKDTVRRGNELRIQLPERMDLIHSIKTDDPSGIEAYWHRRFADKRMNGEWFDLSSADIRAFKRWRKIV